MKLQRFAIAAVAAAVAGTFSVAAPAAQEPVRVVPGESIYVVPHGTMHGGYVTDSDAYLLTDAIDALEADRFTRSAILTIVASNGQLIVNGMADVPQGTRIETKLKALHGGTRVFAWFDGAAGGDGGSSD